MNILYKNLTRLSAPFLTLYLKKRVKQGKEDPERLQERFGISSVSRPQGRLIWFHAASVGESLSLLKLLDIMGQRLPNVTLLVTTGTVTSASLMAKKLPPTVIHQYIPLDIPQWINRFLDHWQPDLAVILESEIWPNMLFSLRNRHIPVVLLNGSLSDKTYKLWQYVPKFARSIFQIFHSCLTPSPLAMERFSHLGIKTIHQTANLKLTCDPLAYDLQQAQSLKTILENRPHWTAASTHVGEEEIVLAAHKNLKESHPHLLTILAPRHPARTPEILALCQKHNLTVAQKSLNEAPSPNTDIWLIDTLGDMGLIYFLSDIVFIGGTFVPLGGHNPIEAMQLNAVVLYGSYDKNFRDNYTLLQPAMIKVSQVQELINQVNFLLKSPDEREHYIQKGLTILQSQQDQLTIIVDHLLEALPS